MKLNRVNAPIRDQVLKHIRKAIVGGKFKPGERLSEPKLCEFVDASRTTIREVLRHLESEGLIKVIPQKGPIVATITVEEAKQLYEVREILEGFMCRLFAERATSNGKAALRRSLELLEMHANNQDLESQHTESDVFYKILWEECGNKVLGFLLKSLNARISWLSSISFTIPGRPLESAKELRGMFEAIEKGDVDAAWEASTYHVRKACSSALEYLSNSSKAGLNSYNHASMEPQKIYSNHPS